MKIFNLTNFHKFQDFLDKSPLELMALLGYTYHQLQDLSLIISRAAAPSIENV